MYALKITILLIATSFAAPISALAKDVVAIEITGVIGQNRGTGTPVSYNPDTNTTYILTCNHIFKPNTIRIRIAKEGKIYEASEVARHPKQDLAIIATNNKLDTVPVQSAALVLGQCVTIEGFAKGLAPPDKYYGMTYNYNPKRDTYFISTNVINGVSGGPVTNSRGEICGVVTHSAVVKSQNFCVATSLASVRQIIATHVPPVLGKEEIIIGPEPEPEPESPEVITVLPTETITPEKKEKPMFGLFGLAMTVLGTAATGGTLAYMYKGYKAIKVVKGLKTRLKGEEDILSSQRTGGIVPPQPQTPSETIINNYLPANPQPTIPQTVAEKEYQTSTQYIAPDTLVTEVDHFSQAVDWAQRQILLKNPGAIDTIQHFNHLVSQYMEGANKP